MWHFRPLEFGPTVGAKPSAPAWADPSAMMALTAYRFVTIPCAQGVNPEVMPNNPKRVAIGFAGSETPTMSGRAYPAGSHPVSGWRLETPSITYWFDLFHFGAMVCGPWNCFADNAADLYVHEIYRLA